MESRALCSHFHDYCSHSSEPKSESFVIWRQRCWSQGSVVRRRDFDDDRRIQSRHPLMTCAVCLCIVPHQPFLPWWLCAWRGPPVTGSASGSKFCGLCPVKITSAGELFPASRGFSRKEMELKREWCLDEGVADAEEEWARRWEDEAIEPWENTVCMYKLKPTLVGMCL